MPALNLAGKVGVVLKLYNSVAEKVIHLIVCRGSASIEWDATY